MQRQQSTTITAFVFVIVVFVIVVFVIVASAQWVQALTLSEAFEAAKSNTATVIQKELAEDISLERQRQAQAQFLPTVTASSTSTWRDQTGTVFSDTYQRSTSIGVSQPLFQGGREYHGLQIANRLPDIAEMDRVQTEIKLYSDVAHRYFDILRIEQETKTLTEQLKILSRRLREIRERARIGRSKASDVLATQAQEARISADLARLEARHIEARQRLQAITGLETIGSLTSTPDPKTLRVEDQWEGKLLNTPSVRWRELLLENARTEIRMANSNFMPRLNAGANYYLERPTGALQPQSDWDVNLTATWQIYSGGHRRAERNIQSLEVLQLERELDDIRRNLTTSFTALREELSKQKEITDKLERAVDLSLRNYREHVREADQGLVNTLDVLRTMDEYLQIKRTYDQQVYDTKLTWIRLRTLVGVQP